MMKLRDTRTWRRIVNSFGGGGDPDSIRRPDTSGMKAKLTTQQKAAMFRMSENPDYQVLLDVFEMACVEGDAQLLNTDPANPEAVLAQHRLAQARWQVFVAIQKKVAYERGEYLAGQNKQQETPDLEFEGDEPIV